MRDGLVNFQTKGLAESSFSLAARFACVSIYARHRLHLPHSDCLKYLFTSSARGGAIRSCASNYRARANARFYLPFYDATFNPLHTRDTRGTRGVHTHISRTQEPMMFTTEKAVPWPLQARGSSWLSSSRSAVGSSARRET